MGLAKCISSIKGVTSSDKNYMLNRSKELQSSGMSALEADRKVLKDMLSQSKDKLLELNNYKEGITVEVDQDLLDILNNFQESEFDSDFDSVKRNRESDNLEVRYGVRVNDKLKKFAKAKYKEVLAKLVEINNDLAKNSLEHKARVVKIRDNTNNREYFGIEIYRLNYTTGNVFDSFKRTKDKTSSEVFGKTLSGDIYISNIPLAIQDSVIEDISTLFLDNLLRDSSKAGSEKEAIEKAIHAQYEKIQKYIADLTKLVNVKNDLKATRLLYYMQNVSDNYAALANMSIRALSASTIINARKFSVNLVNNEVIVEHKEVEEHDIEEIVEQEEDDNSEGLGELKDMNEDTSHWETEGSIKINSKKTISKELKLFLTDIRNYDQNGNIKLNFFRGRSLVPFDVVYNSLARILSNRMYYGNSIESMIKVIEENYSSMPYLRDVVKKLRYEMQNNNSKIPYQFQRAMVKHKVNMYYLGFNYKKDKEDGKRRFSIFPVDSNSVYNGKVISNNWLSAFRMGEYVTIDEKLGDDTITKKNHIRLKLQANKKANNIYEANKKYLDSIEDNQPSEELRKVLFDSIDEAFEIIGVYVQNSVIDDIIDNKLRYFGNDIGIEAIFKTSHKTGSSGHYMRFVSSMSSKIGEAFSLNNPFSHNFIEALSEHESNYNSIEYSDSFTDQTNKSIYTYSNFKYLIERAVKLVENPYVDKEEKTRLITQLGKVPFISNSTWLKKLERGDLNSSNFRIKYADAILNFNKSGSAKKVKNAPIADIEMYKLGLFMNRGFKDGNNRSVTYVYPTLSDGGTIMEVTAFAEDIILNENNTIGLGTLDKLYEAIVVPEINRIRDFQAKGNTELKNYDNGASKFLFLPDLNDPSLKLFDENGKLKKEFTEEDLDNIYDVIDNYVTNLVQNKIDEWIDYGILKSSNAAIASIPMLYEKSDLVTKKDIDDLVIWDNKGYVIKSNEGLNKVLSNTDKFNNINQVVYVYETDEIGSLNSDSGVVAQKLYNMPKGTKGLYKNTYGLSVLPDPDDIENPIKNKNQIIQELRKLSKVAEENPDKLFVINMQTYEFPSKNYSGYNSYNISEMFATVKFPSNIAIKSNIAKSSLTIAGKLKDVSKEDLENDHKRAKLSVYKDHRLFFIDRKYYDSVFGENDNIDINRPYYVAANYVINYMIANANIHQLFIGDPALYYTESKKENASILDNVKATFDNINKRLAGDRAPGEFMADSFNVNETYKQLFLPDQVIASEARELMLSLGYDYGRINGSDAQELTTLKEDLYIRYKMGMITKALYDALYSENGIITKEIEKGNHDYYGAIENGLKKSLKNEFRTVVNQPMKPVYVNNITQEVNGQFIDRRIYIKSSAFALTPKLTKNKELDKLRIYMEKNDIARAAFESAVKVGDTTRTANINFFNKDGTINIDEIALNNNLTELSRDGFRIQQDIPFKEDKINVKFGVQESVLLFGNIIDEVIGDTSVRDLKKEYDSAYGELYRSAIESVYEELGIPVKEINEKGFNKNNIANISESKLAKLIYTEALNRGYSNNELQALGITNGKFDLRLAFHSRGLSIESVLNSIINNRVIKQKFYGKGFILGSQEGFKYLEDKDLRDRIIYTRDIIDELKPMGFTNEKGEYVSIDEAGKEGIKFQPAQVFVPSILRNDDGTSIDLFEKDEHGKWKYLIIKQGRLILNHKSVDPDILKVFGFRIPTQGHNSMSYIEIAGFLPKEAGDLIIAPRDFVEQMGSDFDVDKLYTYMYNVETVNGKIRKVSSKGNTKSAIKNKILDIHFKILSAPNKKIQKQIFEPLGFGMLKSAPGSFVSSVKDIEDIVNDEYEGNLGNYIYDLNDVSDRKFTGISDMYQRDTFLEGRDGAIGIGVFSLNSTLNAAMQYTDTRIGNTVENSKTGEIEFVESVVYFGDNRSNHAYDSSTVHSNERLKFDKSQVISWYQSASVDNAKEKILFKLNINSDTFGAIAYLNQIGFHEEVIWFINQPIIKDYVKQKQISSSSIVVGDNNIDKVDAAVNKKYRRDVVKPGKGKEKIRIEDETGKEPVYSDGKRYSIEKLHTMLKQHKSGSFSSLSNKELRENGDAIEYYRSQLAILELFKEYERKGNTLQNLQNVTNSNSKGAGKTLSEAHIKANEIVDLSESKIFDGVEDLVGSYVTQLKYNKLSEKEREGYINVGEGLYIKPNTIIGYASIYGTVASSYIFNSIFPYGSSSVTDAVELINDISGYKSESITTRAKNVNSIWNEIKKFSNARVVEEIATFIPYERLLLDTYDENGRLNMSLASIIRTIKVNNSIKGNSFFDGLKVNTSKSSNKFSTVEFNINDSGNINNNLVYQGFSDLIMNNRSLGEFNGVEYTTRNLADDLIKYSLISGGVQQFNQFIKYVPFKYLQAIGYTDAINSIDFNDSEAIGYKFSEDYTNTPEFVTQYFQHNPDKAPKVALINEFINVDTTKDLKDVNSFIVNVQDVIDKAKKRRSAQKLLRSRVNEEGPVLVEFLSIFNYTTRKFQLYKLQDSVNGRYARISTLGSNGVNEYSYKNQFENTFKTTILHNEEKKLIVRKDVSYTDIFSNINDNTLNAKYDLSSGDVNVILTNLISTVELIENKTEQDNVNLKLAKELLKLTDTFNVPIIIDNTLTSEGRYISDKKHILINDNYISKLPDKNRAFERIFLHEYLHAVTVRIIKEDKENPHISSLQGIIDHTINHLKSTNTFDVTALLNRITEAKKNKQPLEVTTEEAKYLGLQNPAEFISEFMTNPEFRELLSEIKYKDKTLYEAIIEFIIDIINSFGLNIPKGTAAEAGFQNIIAIINTVEDNMFNDNIATFRFPVKKKNEDSADILSDASNSITSEEELDSLIRSLVDDGRLEIHCKL